MFATARVRGASRVERRLEALAARARDLGEASAPDVARDISDGWLRSLSRSGPGWQPLKPSTVRQRIAEGYSPGPPLIKTGALQRALARPVVDAERDGASFAVSTDHPYPLLGHGKTPARPVKLDRTAVRASTRTISRTLHSAYRRG